MKIKVTILQGNTIRLAEFEAQVVGHVNLAVLKRFWDAEQTFNEFTDVRWHIEIVEQEEA